MLPCPFDVLELGEIAARVDLIVLVGLAGTPAEAERFLGRLRTAGGIAEGRLVVDPDDDGDDVADFHRARIGEEIGRAVDEQRRTGRMARRGQLVEQRRVGIGDEAAADRGHRRRDEQRRSFVQAPRKRRGERDGEQAGAEAAEAAGAEDHDFFPSDLATAPVRRSLRRAARAASISDITALATAGFIFSSSAAAVSSSMSCSWADAASGFILL